MKTILLSLKDEVYKNVVSGKKIYEHRRNFPNELILAYLYVSSPRKVITGKMILKNRIPLEIWLEKYKDDNYAVNRIKKYMKNYRYAIEISEFQETTEISLDTLRNELENFIVPQMYYFIDNTKLLEYLQKNLINKEMYIKNIYDDITSDSICIH